MWNKVRTEIRGIATRENLLVARYVLASLILPEDLHVRHVLRDCDRQDAAGSPKAPSQWLPTPPPA